MQVDMFAVPCYAYGYKALRLTDYTASGMCFVKMIHENRRQKVHKSNIRRTKWISTLT